MAERMAVTDVTGQPRTAGYSNYSTANSSAPRSAVQNVRTPTVTAQAAVGVDAPYTAYGPGVIVPKNGAYLGNGSAKIPAGRVVPQPVMRQL